MSGGGGYGPASGSGGVGGGGRIGGGGSGGGSSGTRCDGLIFEVVLQSPKPTAVKQLIVGDRLSVVSKGVDGPLVAVHKKHGEVGSIVSRLMADLLRCIQQGTKYSAEVIGLNGGQVRVRVTPV